MTASTHPLRHVSKSSKRSRRADRAATVVLWATAALALALLGGIIVYLVVASIGVVSPAFLFGDPSDTELGGIFPFFWNSLYILGLTMLISTPIGILAGIYMAEYASENRMTNAIRFAEEAISSVPSIVVGLFGLIAFVNLTGWGYTALSGALALTLFNLPLLARLTEQALRAVPDEERAGSLALGATKWQTVRHVVLPLAIPGIITGIILTAGRVFGEAAVLLFTAGQSTPTHYDFTNIDLTDPSSPWSPLRPATTLAVFVWRNNAEGLSNFATELADGSSAVLLGTVLVFNLAARGFGRFLTRRLTAV